MREVVLGDPNLPYTFIVNLEVGLGELAQLAFVCQPVEGRCAFPKLLSNQCVKLLELLRLMVAWRCGARDRPCWWGLSGGVGVIDTAAANMFPEAPLMMP